MDLKLVAYMDGGARCCEFALCFANFNPPCNHSSLFTMPTKRVTPTSSPNEAKEAVHGSRKSRSGIPRQRLEDIPLDTLHDDDSLAVLGRHEELEGHLLRGGQKRPHLLHPLQGHRPIVRSEVSAQATARSV